MLGFGLACGLLITFVPYERYSSYLKWLCLSVIAYVGIVFAVHVPWSEVARQLFWPNLQASNDYVTASVAIFGTTISPYLFFWQASQEAERQLEDPEMKHSARRRAKRRRNSGASSWTPISAWGCRT